MDVKTPEIVGATANPIINRVWQLAEPLCRGEGVELVHVEYGREHGGRTLRIYLDKAGGITLDDCAHISRQLSDILDVGLETEGAYRLEVSSPGMQRPLGKMDDFERYKGKQVKIRTTQPINGQKNFTGILTGVSGPTVHLEVDKRPVAIAFTDIAKAHITHMNGDKACL
ncbi:MAG: ribosome maturation factor RimP [Desulfobacteraceae bacterium]|jgi:ribosome maturation factor RimP